MIMCSLKEFLADCFNCQHCVLCNGLVNYVYGNDTNWFSRLEHAIYAYTVGAYHLRPAIFVHAPLKMYYSYHSYKVIATQLKKLCSLTHSVLFLKCDLIQNKLKVEQIVHSWELYTAVTTFQCVYASCLYCVHSQSPHSEQHMAVFPIEFIL